MQTCGPPAHLALWRLPPSDCRFPGAGNGGSWEDANAEKAYKPIAQHLTTVAGNEALVSAINAQWGAAAAAGARPIEAFGEQPPVPPAACWWSELGARWRSLLVVPPALRRTTRPLTPAALCLHRPPPTPAQASTRG